MNAEQVQPISNRELARRLDVDEKAVRLAIASGRLRECLAVDERGRTVVADPDLAMKEWSQNAGQGARNGASAFGAHGTLNEAQRIATLERYRKLRLENDLQEGRQIDVGEAQREAFESSRVIRENVLNVPSRLAAELAAETDAAKVFIRLTAALHEALSAAADQLQQESA